MGLARARNRTLAYFEVIEPDEADFPAETSLFKSALGILVGAAVAGALFGLFEHDIASGAIFGALWLGLMVLRSAWARRRARRSSP
jgi:predicted lipid-binding transport protein (Tim44 family)